MLEEEEDERALTQSSESLFAALMTRSAEGLSSFAAPRHGARIRCRIE